MVSAGVLDSVDGSTSTHQRMSAATSRAVSLFPSHRFTKLSVTDCRPELLTARRHLAALGNVPRSRPSYAMCPSGLAYTTGGEWRR